VSTETDSALSTYIDGEWREGQSSERITTTSPSTGEVLGVTPASSPGQVDAAVASARAAFDSAEWRAYGPAERAAVLNQLADLFEANREELAQLIVDEVGSPIGLARAMQVGSPIEALRWYAEMAIRGPRGGYEHALPLYDKPVLSSSVLRYEPVGVVAALSAFNYPFNLLIWKLGGALAAGCTAVVLPSPQGALCTIRLFGLIDELGLPPGVVNLVVGGPEVGRKLTGHPDVDMVSFTGSDAVGGKVMSQAALGGLAKSVLELGGKAANIILPGTELEPTIAPSVLRFARNAGQGCAAWTRILVHESQVDEFVKRTREFVDNLQVGDPHSEKTEVGPVISVAHRDRVEAMIQQAVTDGGEVIIGGGRPKADRGAYINPAVIAGVSPDHPIANTELFAPIAVLIPYTTVDEAVRIANQTPYGLNANVFGPLADAIAVAQRLRAGTVTVNGGSGMRPDAPWGGLGRSGVGRELGEDGFAEFFEVKHIQWPLGPIGRPPGT
jgi:aldehyde dehydrogenase (NAD+)